MKINSKINYQSSEKLEYTGERITLDHKTFYAFKRIYFFVSEKFGNPDKTVLDYGCGSGYGCEILQKNFKHVSGIDVSSDTIIFCKNTFANLEDRLSFKQLNPESQPFPDQTFNYIFSFQVMEHVPLNQIETYLQNIWNMLKDGGTAIITTPNSHNYFGGFSGNPYHIKEYTREDLVSTLNKTISTKNYKIYTVSDVWSTQVRIKITRCFKNNPTATNCSHLLCKPLVYLERKGFISTAYKKMLHKSDSDKTIGSYYIEISKNA